MQISKKGSVVFVFSKQIENFIDTKYNFLTASLFGVAIQKTPFFFSSIKTPFLSSVSTRFCRLGRRRGVELRAVLDPCPQPALCFLAVT